MANGTLGRGTEVNLRRQPIPQQAVQAGQVQRPAQGPNVGAMIDDTLTKEYQQLDGQTMDIYNKWGETRNYAQAMWKNFNIDVTTPDFSNPASVQASRAFMQQVSSLRNMSNEFSRGAKFESGQEAALLSNPDVKVDRGADEIAGSGQARNEGLTDLGRIQAQDAASAETTYGAVGSVDNSIAQNIAMEQANLENDIASGDEQAIKATQARIAKLEQLKAKNPAPRAVSPGGTTKNPELDIRLREAESLISGTSGTRQVTPQNPKGIATDETNILSDLVDTNGNPAFDMGHVNAFNGKIYGYGNGAPNGLALNVSGEDYKRILNRFIGGVTGEKVKSSELYSKTYLDVDGNEQVVQLGKPNFVELGFYGDPRGGKKVQKEYYTSRDNTIKAMYGLDNRKRSGKSLNAYLGFIGMQGSDDKSTSSNWRLPIGTRVENAGTGSKKDDLFATPYTRINSITVGKDGSLNVIVQDRPPAAPDKHIGFKEWWDNGASGGNPWKTIKLHPTRDKAKIQEIFDYNMQFGSVHLPGYSNTNMPENSVYTGVEPDDNMMAGDGGLGAFPAVPPVR